MANHSNFSQRATYRVRNLSRYRTHCEIQERKERSARGLHATEDRDMYRKYSDRVEQDEEYA